MTKETEMRTERKNDNLILEKLGEIQVGVAVIKNEQSNTNEHLKTLNGKVATQEARQQATDSSVALNAQALGILLKEKESNKSFWERNWEKLFWFVLASAWAYLNIKR